MGKEKREVVKDSWEDIVAKTTKEICSVYKNDFLCATADKYQTEYTYVPTGIFRLDKDLGGGIIVGKWYCFWGTFRAGKSTALYKSIAQFQHRCRHCNEPEDSCSCGNYEPYRVVYFNLEKTAFDARWARDNGVILERLYVQEPETFEQLADIGNKLISSGDWDVICIDSLATIETMRTLEKSAEDGVQLAEKSSKYGRCFNSWLSGCHSMSGSHKVTVLATNQYRQDPNAYGKGYMPGGNTIKHRFDTIIQFHSSDSNDNTIRLGKDKEGPVVGQKTTYVVQRNRTYPSGRKGQFSIYTTNMEYGGKIYSRGATDNIEQIGDTATLMGFITSPSQGYFLVPGCETKIHGAGAVMDYLYDNPEIVEGLKDKIFERERLMTRGTNAIPQEIAELEIDTIGTSDLEAESQ